MIRLAHRIAFVSAIALAGSTMVPAAQASQLYPHHRAIAHRPLGSRGDVVVHTGKSYLDPGTSAAVGTEDRYAYDTAHVDIRSEGPDFTRHSAGFELLPGPLDPPGRPEPLFVFSTPGAAKASR